MPERNALAHEVAELGHVEPSDNRLELVARERRDACVAEADVRRDARDKLARGDAALLARRRDKHGRPMCNVRAQPLKDGLDQRAHERARRRNVDRLDIERDGIRLVARRKTVRVLLGYTEPVRETCGGHEAGSRADAPGAGCRSEEVRRRKLVRGAEHVEVMQHN